MPETIQPLWTHPARLEAERAGRKRFYAGRCANGHDGERFVDSLGCVECSRLRNENNKFKSAKLDIVTRGDAEARGLKVYFTGERCGRGHLCRRWTISARCTKCQQLGLYHATGPEAEALEDQIADLNARSAR
jgi:hypothetical protein